MAARAIVKDAGRGLLAGGAGALVLERLNWILFQTESEKLQNREIMARVDGLDAPHVFARRFAEGIGKPLAPNQVHPAGVATCFMFSMIPAAVYAILLNRMPKVGFGKGLIYGFFMFLFLDEWVAPRLGVASEPKAYPWQAHARGLVNHLALGVTTYAVIRWLSGKRF